ncbi:2-methylcitrate dehydratase, partial [Campylobacter coli]|nr:2-methylcitrate dehydratase [Campylobacter coli]
MSDMGILEAKRPEFDELLTKIAKYADEFEITSDLALETARYC